ncbi:Beta-1,3-glucosyltransferase [Thermogutta terrifontis]|uniref:Beta-1,3-glucosyltransferase n=1 Tax=Thermogutta terrifontis TaxID=1331910 RepID=A0A286RG83_9BACT|nr:glycosyltransferase [Thermogutta terrifontis]ASV74952.1 Beta-1,3-glucosyltransferase [Thermogutta terrifontis]
MGKLLISVNMCVYRPHPVYFREAVQSVLNQTFEDFELIIVEDPSEVDGREIISDLLSDSRIRYIHNDQRTGLIAQRNQALKESRCDWVAILDADDVARPERLQKQWEFLHVNPSIRVLGSWIEIIDQNGQLVGLRRYPECHDAIMRTMRRYNAIAQPAAVIHRPSVDRIGGYSGQIYVEDYELWCRMLRNGARFANIPQALTRYRIHSSGGSKTTHLRHVLRETIRIKKEYFGTEMDLGDRLRIFLEFCLLFLPPRWVYRLFAVVTFTRSKRPDRYERRRIH